MDDTIERAIEAVLVRDTRVVHIRGVEVGEKIEFIVSWVKRGGELGTHRGTIAPGGQFSPPMLFWGHYFSAARSGEFQRWAKDYTERCRALARMYGELTTYVGEWR